MSTNGSRRLGPGIDAGVTEAMIRKVVHAFYARVRTDEMLCPIFERAIGGDWDRHLVKMCDFWSSVLLMTGRFKGAPMAVHARLDGIDAIHFERWLALFRRTVGEACPAAAAALFIAKSEVIAESLQLGIAASRRILPTLPPGARGC